MSRRRDDQIYQTEPDRTVFDKDGQPLLSIWTPITEERMAQLKNFALEQLRAGHYIGDLPQIVGVMPSVLRSWRIEDPVFSAEFDAAANEGEQKRINIWIDDFLADFRQHFNVGRACRFAGIGRITYSRAYRDNEEFRQAVDEARAECMDNVEGGLYDRALGSGKEANMAAIMLLNAHRADIYKGKGEKEVGTVTFNLIMGKKEDDPKKLPPQTGTEIVIDG